MNQPEPLPRFIPRYTKTSQGESSAPLELSHEGRMYTGYFRDKADGVVKRCSLPPEHIDSASYEEEMARG